MPVAQPGPGRTAEQILADTARITDPALMRAVNCLPSPLRESVYYHYGWAGRDGGPATGVRGGTGRKGIAFTLLCAGIDGGPVERGLPAVVAGNLLMNVATLHDDIVDLEARRRGRPTVLAAYTTGHAIMAGDALLALAFSHLGEHPHPRTQQALRTMRAGWLQLCAGQVRDEEHEGRCETSLDQAVSVQAAKTAEGVRAVCCLPALLTDASGAQVEAVGRFGFHLGMAVQYHNDLSDLWPAEQLSRSRYGDVRRRKITPTVAACLESGHRDSGRLAAFYRGDGEPAEEGLAAVADLIDRCGGRAWTREQNHAHLRLALQSLQEADPPPAVYRDAVTLAGIYQVGDAGPPAHQ
ncbi:polyprenyl synthetase family protein [Nonomuraea sp. NPDC048881]|uniref:polyprenyl synthetase family protein n=1 Tax=Nonomuraea sp. NPDC048881 TaxID=3155030 RepID=UPI0033D8741F